MLLSAVLFAGCSDPASLVPDDDDPATGVTGTEPDYGTFFDNMSHVPDGEIFDQDVIDFMPTPTGQSGISVPWTGQGALMHDIGVINDHRKSDGWVLLYSSFTTDDSFGHLVNPFFILYNRYRGLMRVYLYVTDRVVSSDYLMATLVVKTGRDDVRLLNFMGGEVVDGSTVGKMYRQLVPDSPISGRMITSLSWKMMQYELAYDPLLAAVPSDSLRLVLDVGVRNVARADIGGGFIDRLGCSLGQPSGSRILAEDAGGNVSGRGTVLFSGDCLSLSGSAAAGNRMGIDDALYSELAGGMEAAAANLTDPSRPATVNLLNAVVGGTSGLPPVAGMAVDTDVSFEGVENTLPLRHFPVELYVPGAGLSADAHSAYRPLADVSLGVCNMTVTPDFVVPVRVYEFDKPDMTPSGGVSHITLKYAYPPVDEDFTRYLTINPDVKRVADVEVRQEIIPATHNLDTLVLMSDPEMLYSCSGAGQRSEYVNRDYGVTDFNVRFTITVTPKDGSLKSVIYKTFRLNTVWQETRYGYEPDGEDTAG